jgi:Trk-type K+ transport system membrane component
MVMFIGRVGPLAIALVIGKKEVRQVLHYPEEEVVVG